MIFRGFCSLRLSVRTPPFHGGESGSIPLGSASSVGAAARNKATEIVARYGGRADGLDNETITLVVPDDKDQEF